MNKKHKERVLYTCNCDKIIPKRLIVYGEMAFRYTYYFRDKKSTENYIDNTIDFWKNYPYQKHKMEKGPLANGEHGSLGKDAECASGDTEVYAVAEVIVT